MTRNLAAGTPLVPSAKALDFSISDQFQSKEINYHYLLVEVDHQQLKVRMNRVDVTSGKAVWTQPDAVVITVPAAAAHAAGQ